MKQGWFDVLQLYFFGTFFKLLKEDVAAALTKCNRLEIQFWMILDPPLKIEKKISKNQQNKRLDFRLYILYSLR